MIKKKKIPILLITVMTIIAAVTFIMPFYICVVTALKTQQESSEAILALPHSLMLDNFKEAIKRSNFVQSFFNTILVTSISTIGIVLFSTMSGYVLCRNSSKRFYRIMNSMMFVGIMIPFQVIMIPVYRLYKNLSLLNTYTGIILLMIGTSIPYAIYLVMGFVKSIPKELEEAAKIDGCQVYQVFWLIVFPLLKPIASTVGILHMLWMWNEFNMSFIILQQEKMRTIPIQQYHFFGQFTVDLNLGFASALISMIPVVIFFIFTQRFLISGITSGAVKG